jgi:uncharacterized protein with ATP-grasp and redox domains
MKSWDREPDSHVGIVKPFLEMAGLEGEEASVVATELERYMRVHLDRKLWMSPHITRYHTEWYRELYRVTGATDPYAQIKRDSCDTAQRILTSLPQPTLRDAILRSVVANRLDFGIPKNAFARIDEHDFEHLETRDLHVDHVAELEAALRSARRVMFLLDNAGEVLFDMATAARVVAENPGVEVTLVAKSEPMLNDVTFPELAELELPAGCVAMSTGSNCFGVPLEEVSETFVRAYEEADVVVAKGHAFLEFWIEYVAPRVFNLAYTKFPIVDRNLGVIPDHVSLVLQASRYAEGKAAYGAAGV